MQQNNTLANTHKKYGNLLEPLVLNTLLQKPRRTVSELQLLIPRVGETTIRTTLEVLRLRKYVTAAGETNNKSYIRYTATNKAQ